jgi:hypothetical protein
MNALYKIIVSILLAACTAWCQDTLTTVSEVIHDGAGNPVSGSCTFRAATGRFLGAAQDQIIGEPVTVKFKSGAFFAKIVPTDTGVPVGQYYAASCVSDTRGWSKTGIWLVPTSSTPVTWNSIWGTTPPNPSAMIPPSQVVSAGIGAGTFCFLSVNGTVGWNPCPNTSAANYNFTPQTPGGTLTSGITNTISLPLGCPLGVSGTDVAHYVYLSNGTGTAEATPITGGTCTSGAPSGTITVTPANNHSGAWTVGSASVGIQEAINSAIVGSIVPVPPGAYTVSPITISSKINLSLSSGAVLTLRNNSNFPVITITAGGSSISGGEINGNGTNNTSPPTIGNDGVAVNGASKVEVSGIYIHNCANAGVLLTGATTESSVHDNHFSANGMPAWMSGSGVAQNVIRNNTSNGDVDGIYANSAGRNIIASNIIENTTGPWPSPDNAGCIYFDTAQTVTGNTLTNCGNKGITNFFATNCTITNNVILNSGALATSVYRGTAIEINDGNSCVIQGNFIRSPSGAGILILDTINAVVTSNRIENAGQWCPAHLSESQPQVCSAIAMFWESQSPSVASTANNTIALNVFTGAAVYGIREDDFNSPVQQAHFLTNTYLGNYGFASGTTDLSLAPNTTAIVACNNLNAIYGSVGCSLLNPVFSGLTVATGNMEVQTIPVATFKVGTGPNGGNADGILMKWDNGPHNGYTDVSGPFIGLRPWIITDQSTSWNGCVQYEGTGSPNGVVTGNPCDRYWNKSGGSGTTMYVKESGTASNTGWVGK